jgi:hypothetical protein
MEYSPEEGIEMTAQDQLPIGVWMNDENAWMYRGKHQIVVEFASNKKFPLGKFVASKCFRCQASAFAGGKIKRWMILPE